MTKEELKLHIEKKYSVCSKRTQGLSYGSFYDGYMDCYSELEKENAELIQENEEMKKGLGCETCQIHLEYMSLNNRIAELEKANEMQALRMKERDELLAELKAEEYADKDFGMYEPTDHERYAKETDWRNGAEFGYNKANEWHYVKDGDYPKDNKPVLCILGAVDSDNCEVGYYNDVESGEPWHFETYHLPDDDGDNAWGVFAWKEIVLPKEILSKNNA